MVIFKVLIIEFKNTGDGLLSFESDVDLTQDKINLCLSKIKDAFNIKANGYLKDMRNDNTIGVIEFKAPEELIQKCFSVLKEIEPSSIKIEWDK